MNPVTLEDRRNELHSLLDQLRAEPTRDWTAERQRILVLRQMIATEELKAEQQAEA
jgi:hypothetical protein